MPGSRLLSSVFNVRLHFRIRRTGVSRSKLVRVAVRQRDALGVMRSCQGKS